MSVVTGSSSRECGPASICSFVRLTATSSVSPRLIIGSIGFGGSVSGAIADGWMNTWRPGSQ
jgi:hypothetical protein